jgi:ATP-binding cassette subfamily C protein LapB
MAAPSPSIQAFAAFDTVPKPALVATVAENLLAFAIPLAVMQIYDRVIPNASFGTLQLLTIGLMAALLLELVFKLVRMRVIEWHAAGALFRAQIAAGERLLAQPSSAFERTSFGVQMDRLAALDTLKENLQNQPVMRAVDAIFVVAILLVMAAAGGWLVLVPLTLISLLVLIAWRQHVAHAGALERRNESDRRRYSFLHDVLDGLPTVKALLMEEQMLRRYERLQAAGARITREILLIGSGAQTTAMLVSALHMVAVIGLGAWFVIHEQMALGALAASLLLGGRAIQLVVRIFGSSASADITNDARARIREFAGLPAYAGGRALRLPAAGGALSVVFRGASFGVDPSLPPVIENFDLAIEPGQAIGFRGNEGAGASTLLRVLIGETDIRGGEVLIEGDPVQDIDRDSLLQSVGFAANSVGIFRGTLLDNLTMFESGEAIDRARRASALTGLERLINQLPDGFETEIGGNGGRELPRGLVQLIGITRALAKQPRLLILDEANASLDRDSEAILLQALETLRGRVTILIATQRPSLLRFCDHVVDLNRSEPAPAPSERTTS